MFLFLIIGFGSLASYNSSFQTTLVRQYIKSLSKKLGNKITVGNVNVSLINKVILTDLYVEDLHQDTLLYAKRLVVEVDEFSLENKKIILGDVALNNTFFNLKKYKNDSTNNLSFIINHFATSDTTKSSWEFGMTNLELVNTKFNYNDEHFEEIPFGVDYKHIGLSYLDLSLSNISLISKGVDCKINKLNFYEKSGFQVDDFESEFNISPSGIIAQNLKVKTPYSSIDGNVTFLTDDYAGLANFIEDVNIKSYFENTKVDFKDLCFFAPTLYCLNKSLVFSGEIKGRINNLKGRKLDILIDDGTRFNGSADISGLPSSHDMFMYVKVKELITTKEKIESIPLYPFIKETFIKLPNNFRHLGTLRFSGNFTGFYHDFVAYGKLKTSLGNVSTDVSLKLNDGNPHYKGRIITNHFNMGRFFEMKNDLGDITMNVDVDGEGFTKNELNASLKGNIEQVVVKGYEYNNVEVKGDFKEQIFAGFLAVKDENVSFDFDGKIDLSKKVPEINFISNIENAKLGKLNLVKSKKKLKTRFSTQLEVNLKGKTADEIVGTVQLNNSRYHDKLDSILIEKLLVTSKLDGYKKNITVTSDVLDANLTGEFKFNEIANYISDFMGHYIPIQKENKKALASLPNDVNFNIDFHNTEIISKLFLGGVKISDNAKFNGGYKAKEHRLTLTGSSEIIDVFGTEIRNFEFNGQANDDLLSLNVDAEQIYSNDSLYIDNFNINSVAGGDSALTNILWVNNKVSTKNEGDITLKTNFNSYSNISNKIVDSYVYVSDSLWSVNPLNEIIIDTNYFTVNDFKIFSSTQSVNVNGTLSDNSDEQLNLLFKDLNLLTFKRLIPEKIINLKGVVNGSTSVKSKEGAILLNSNLSFNQFEINSYLIGDGIVQSEWSNAKESLKLNGKFYRSQIPTLSFGGFYYPMKEEESLDLNLELFQTELSMFDNYTKEFLDNFNGQADAFVTLTGSFKEPSLKGELNLNNTGFTVKYLNAHYRTPFCRVNIEPDMISFDNVEFIDEKGSVAHANGTVYHEWFKDWSVGVGLDVNNFLALNTKEEDNGLYYGKAFVSGLVDISVYNNQLGIDVNVITEKNSVLNIPLADGEELEENNFIEFISHDTTEIALEEDVDLSNIEMNFDLEITPDAEVRLIFDDQIGDVMRATGSGNINLQITKDGDLDMFGNYVVKDGDYLFTLQNVINKRFDLEEGGTISWNGSPYDAEIDLTAIYRTRARLYDLLANIDTNEVYKKRIPVDLKLEMKDKMMNPNISFDIDLPTADSDTKSKVRSVLYVSSQEENIQELNRQVFSLLVLRSFLPPSGTESTYNRTGVGSTTSSELLSNQLSNWLSKMSNDFDIGVNYRPGDELSSEEYELALSTQFFNDRLILDGNLGYSDKGNVSNEAQNTNNLIGDISVEYKITKDGKLRVKAFNTSNQFSLIETNSPYTQGVGFSYREEYDTNKEFWQNFLNRFRRKSKKKNQ
ncbi:MAG: translocation/assembly module TamB domain-containing protein [Vicingaceae bacterium]